MRRALPLTILVLFAGCGDDKPATAPPAPTPELTPVPRSTPEPRQPPGSTLRFRSSDGKRLTGRLTPAGKGAPAVVLVHQRNGGVDQWDPLIPALHAAGFTTLAYGSRNPGELDESKLARDVKGAVATLRKQRSADPDRILLVGASIGATTVAYVLGTDDLGTLGGVGLSAVEGPLEIQLGDKGRFRPHDLLLIADKIEISSVEGLTRDAHGKGITSFTAPIGGHGVDLLPSVKVRAKLLGWLKHLSR